MRFDTSMESLIGIGRSESFADLNNSDLARNLLSSSSSLFGGSGENERFAISLMENFIAVKNRSTGNARGRHSFSGKSSVEDPLNATANGGKPFGISELHNRFSLRSFFLHTRN